MIVNIKKAIKSILNIEGSKYIIVGFFTTIINYFVFYILVHTILKQNWFFAECLSFMVAVVFAFFMDKYFVFKKDNSGFLGSIKEFLSFISMRLISELVNILGMKVLIDLFKYDPSISKLVLNIVVIILNYCFSKFVIFKK